MQVPGWVLIILALFSAVLVAVSFFCTFIVIRNWWRVRKYDRLKFRRFSVKQCTPLLNQEEIKNYSFTPVTYTTTVQSCTFPLSAKNTVIPVSPASSRSKYKSYNRDRIGASGSFTGGYGANSAGRDRIMEKRVNYNDLLRSMSLDDRSFHRQFRSVNDSIPNFPVSPMMGISNSLSDRLEGSNPIRSNSSSRRNSFSDIPPDSKSMHSGVEITVEDADIYIHSSFLPPDEEHSPEDPVVSFDQDSRELHKPTPFPGALRFALKYNSEEHILIISVKQAFELPMLDDGPGATVNCYVNLTLVPEDFLWKRTRVVEKTRQPVFNETFEIHDVLYHKLREYLLCFFLMDSHVTKGERVIGKVTYPLSDLRAGIEVDACIELVAC